MKGESDGRTDRLQGRHALITGGGTGHRRRRRRASPCAPARRFRCSGAGSSRSKAVASHVGGTAIQCDVTDRDSIARAFDEARAANGPIDMLIVNAGIAESAPFHKMTRESWDRIIAVNLTAAFDCAQAALADLLKSEDGAHGVRRLGREPARRALCGALCRLEARPARPDAQPGGGICQDPT